MKLIWSIKDLVEIAEERQKNKFDVILAISGERGEGKSTLAFKFLSRFKKFKPWKHQVYSRKDVMKILEGSKFSFIFDDEAIRTGYKRKFFEEDQKLLIQMLNMYRDNFNIYVMAIPNFYSLDRDLRDLVKIHIHVIERGLGVVHIANEGILYSDDCWDIKYNQRVEERWGRAKQKNPNYTPKYNRLTTFKGYIKFGDLTPKQRELYEDIKVTKRKAVYEEEMKLDEEGGGFYDKLIERLKGGNITKEILQEICLASGIKYSAVTTMLNIKLTDMGIKETLSHFLKKTSDKVIHNNDKGSSDRFGFRP